MNGRWGKRLNTNECLQYLGVGRVYFLELKRKYNLKPVGKIKKMNVYAKCDIARLHHLLQAARKLRKRMEEFTL